ncbi:hypothetical protein HOY80DRAFT_90480 [Tuber brumale]|nr:hypothetical protein HOY80DRAFT_90480 [Tuber brumale]
MSHLEFGCCHLDPTGPKYRYKAVQKLKTGRQTVDARNACVHFLCYCTSSSGSPGARCAPNRGRAPRAPVWLRWVLGVEGPGGNELQEVTRELRLGVNPFTTRAFSRNRSTNTVSSGGEMAQLDPHSGIR